MFDSAPSNLPVEPPVQPHPLPTNTPPVAPPQPPSTSSKKEPEDIFSGLDQTIMTKPSSSLPPMPEKKPFPVKLVAAIVGGIVVLGGVGYGVWAFVIAPKMEAPVAPQVAQTLPSTPAPLPVEKPPVAIETPPAAAVPTATEAAPTAPVTQPPAGANIPIPTVPSAVSTPSAVVPTEGRDSDNDALTDVEEPYYGADPLKSDTDGDGYPDGSEVLNLFSPAAKNATLASAPFMATLSWKDWTLLAPKPWGLIPNATNTDAVALSTGTATRFQFELLPDPTKETLDAWLASQHVAAPKSFKTKGGFDARQTQDGFVTYLASGDSILRVTYDLNGETTIEYRTSYAMVLNSLTHPAKK